MRRTLGLTLLFIMATILVSCRQEPEPLPRAAETVTDVLAENGFTTLATALTTAGLTETLAGPGPFTLFAPTDKAFAALPGGVPEDADALAELLEYHVLAGKVSAAELEPGFRTTLQENAVAVTLEGESDVLLNGVSALIGADIAADNGVVHGIDTVLTLPETEFSAPLSGSNEVPPVESEATGQVSVKLTGTTLTIDGTYQGLAVEGPGAHIHGPAGVEATADVLFPLEFSNDEGKIHTSIDLSAPENAAFGPAAFGYLQSSLLYANLHTEANPDGEIRGQLLPTEDVATGNPDFTAILSGEEEVPEVMTDGEGTAAATFDEAGTTLTVTGTYTVLSGAPAAGHIHEAAYNKNGPVVIPLTLVPDEADPTSGTFSVEAPIGDGEGQLSSATLADNGYYLNLHTAANPDGEIRGQLTPVPVETPVEAPTSR